jgi:hypothetical protein
MEVTMWRLLIGPAMVVDGLVRTLTLSLLTPKLSLRAALNLARARCKRG